MSRQPARKASPTLTVALFVGIVSSAAFLLIASVLARQGELTAAEVAADGARLAALASATRLTAPASGDALELTYTFGSRCGAYQGLAVLHRWQGEAPLPGEVHLAFVVLASPERLPRNPARRPLPALWLERDPLASDLVARGTAQRLFVELQPPDEAAEPALLGNVAGRPELAAAVSLGRAWGELVAPHHCKLRPEDLRTLATLSRLLRAEVCTADGAATRCTGASLSLYRDRLPRTYRLDVRSLGGDAARAAFGLELSRDAEGRGRSLRLRPLVALSDLPQGVRLAWKPPWPAGAAAVSGGVVHSRLYPPLASPAAKGLPSEEIDLESLLAASAW